MWACVHAMTRAHTVSLQDREKVKKIVQKAEQAGCSALFITCDAPQLGNRERDRRVKVVCL